MSASLKGRSVIVTGGSKGIGKRAGPTDERPGLRPELPKFGDARAQACAYFA